MGIYIPGMEMPKTGCRAICLWASGEVNSTKGDTFAIPVPNHGRLIDADEFLKRALGTRCFRGDYALMLEELVGESVTVIPPEK